MPRLTVAPDIWSEWKFGSERNGVSIRNPNNQTPNRQSLSCELGITWGVWTDVGYTSFDS